MTKSNATRRALLVSALSIVMCLAMLIGTTFAWFTDTASTGLNKIQAGNLDVELEYSDDMVTWKKATSDTKLFKEDSIWEPGHTEVVYIRIVNAGTLALKYSIKFNSFDRAKITNVYGTKRVCINEYMKTALVETDAKFATREDAWNAVASTEKTFDRNVQLTDGTVFLDANSKSPAFALVIYMPTTVGNEANSKSKYINPIKNIGLEVTASQAVKEDDSFDNKYDEDAPIIVEGVSTGSNMNITENVQGSGKGGTIDVQKGAQVTVNADVYAEYDAEEREAVAVWASGENTKVVINGGTFMQVDVPAEHSNHFDLIYADNKAQIEINGGTFKCVTPEWTLNCKDGSSSKIIVSGGSFYKFNPADNSVGEGEIVIHDGFHVVQNGDWFTVVED